MGRAARWLKSLFGIKKDRNHVSEGELRDLCHNPTTIPPNISPAEAAWLQSIYTETEKQQNKHAIAVAAATAAAADAAVAAAQAAVAVVRLTSHGRGTMFGGGGHERWAAVKIQTVFRGYLARKALRALKGLVKLQALVKGYLVRKQATATFHSMQALIRAQATVRSQKARRLMSQDNEACRFEARARRSMERFDDTRSEHTAPVHSRRMSSFDATINNSNSFDGSPKILEVDTGRPRSRSRRTNTSSISDFGDDSQFQALSSPLPVPCCRTPARLSILDCRRNLQDSDWGLTAEECRSSTAQSTPRFTSSCGSFSCQATACRSVCAGDGFCRQYGNFPNYMANTQSFRAKLRSHSAPKQRPEPKRRVLLNELMECRSSLSGVRMQRSCSQVQEAINFKNAVMGKLEKSAESGRGRDSNYWQRRW